MMYTERGHMEVDTHGLWKCSGPLQTVLLVFRCQPLSQKPIQAILDIPLVEDVELPLRFRVCLTSDLQLEPM